MSYDTTKKQLIQESIDNKALLFGEFHLKSGRISPYFFNAGNLYSANILETIAEAFSHKLVKMKVKFDVIFGSAYKGIPLAAITALKYYEKTGINVNYAYNRKEAKDHGEGGILAGAPLNGKRIISIDDVLTAGVAMGESINLISKNSGILVGIVLLLDRLEIGTDGSKVGTLKKMSQKYDIPVEAILDLNDIIEYSQNISPENAQAMLNYRASYGSES